MSEDKTMRERINRISRETGIPTKKVLDLLFMLRTGKPVENNELLQRTGVSKNALNQAKELLSSILKPPSKNTQLDESAVQEVQSLFGLDYKPEETLWTVLEDELYRKSVELLEKYVDQRPSPERKYDQFTATIETTARRASLLNFFEDVQGKKLLFLGDDDFTSVATALSGKSDKITVFEIDKRIVKSIKEISVKEDLDIEIVGYDARKRVLNRYESKYDIVFTDPPYTTEGVSLFLSRGIDLLDKMSEASRIYLCYGNSDRAKERILPIQKVFSDSGLMLRWVFDKFNRYIGAESIGSASSLYIADVTPMAHPTIQGEFNEKIYTV